MFVVALGIRMMQDRDQVRCRVMVVTDMVRFDVEPEHLREATRQQPSTERE